VTRQHGSMRMSTANANLRMTFLEKWTEEAARFFETLKGAPGTLSMNARRAPVMAVAIVTIRFTGTDAIEFWEKVVGDDRLAQGDPCKLLHVFLRTTKVGSFEPHIYARHVAAAWNGAWEDRKLKLLQPGAAHLPIRLEGTPHTGRQVLRYITPRGGVLEKPEPYDPVVWQQGLFKKPGEAA
jgi:hypothetical protein